MEYYKSFYLTPPRECLPITPPYNCDYSLPMTKSNNLYATQTESFIRFPTPPNTPPKQILTPDAHRTKSVIMKVSPDHQITEVEIKTKSGLGNDTLDDTFICRWENCWRSFESLEGLASHVTQIHAVASPGGLYYCKWEGCLRTDRGFNARYKMLVHVRTHTKEKPHQCQLCEKSFSRAENLKIHLRSHSGEKPYICPYDGCNKAYSNSSDRFKHTRTHSTEKPYVCKVPGCQKRYTDPSSLRKHVKTFKHTPTDNLDQINVVSDISNDSQQEIIQHNELPYIEYKNYDGSHHNIYQTQTPLLETSPPPINFNCTHVDCCDQYRQTEIYNYEHYYYGTQGVEPLPPADYWSTMPQNRYHSVQSMDIDVPLDLSLGGRR